MRNNRTLQRQCYCDRKFLQIHGQSLFPPTDSQKIPVIGERNEALSKNLETDVATVTCYRMTTSSEGFRKQPVSPHTHVSLLFKSDLSNLKSHLIRDLVLQMAVTLSHSVSMSLLQKFSRQGALHQAAKAEDAHQLKPAKLLSLFYFLSSTASARYGTVWMNMQMMYHGTCIAHLVTAGSPTVSCSDLLPHSPQLTQCNRKETLAMPHNQQQIQTCKVRRCDSILICYSIQNRNTSASCWAIQALKTLPTLVHKH